MARRRFIADSRTNIANVAPQHELYVNETYPVIQPSYWTSITAESGGTRLEPIACARLVIGSVTGNHVMFIGGLDNNAPFSGRGLPLYAGPQNEREMFIEDASRISICASFSGEMIYYMGYVNGQPTTMNPASQGIQPNNQPPQLVSTNPISGATNVEFRGSGLQFISVFDENVASGSLDVSSLTIRLSGQMGVNAYLSGETSFYQPDDPEDRSKIQFIPYSGQLIGSAYYNVYIGTRLCDDPGSTIPSTLTWSFLTAGLDETPMVLKSMVPLSGTSVVPFSQRIEASFNKAVSGTVNNTGYTNNIVLWNDNIPAVYVSGVTILDDTSSGKTLILTPNDLLLPSTIYRYTVSGVIDRFDNTAAPSSGIAFITGPADTAGPIISGTFPTSGQQQVFVGSNLTVTFNERLSGIPGGTVSHGVFSLVAVSSNGVTSAELSGLLTLDTSGRTLTYNPEQDLSGNWDYEMRVSGLKDVNGNYITQVNPPRSGIRFKASTEADLQPPVINAITPLAATVGVAVNSPIIVTMSEAISGAAGAINPFMAGVQPIAVNLSGTGDIAGVIALNAAHTVLTFTPSANLSGDRNYYVSVSGLQDSNLNRMNPVSGHTFRTIDNISPIVSGITPTSGSVDVAQLTDIVVTFNEAITGVADTTNYAAKIIGLYVAGSPASTVAGTITFVPNTNKTQLTFNPDTQLVTNTSYQVSVSGVRDCSGNLMITASGTSGHHFSTQGGPIILSTNPVSGASQVALNSNIVITFNEALTGEAGVNFVTTPIGVRVNGGGTPLAGVTTLNSDKKQLTFNPSADLAANTTYHISVSGVRDETNLIISQTSPPRSGIVFNSLTVDTTPPSVVSVSPANATSGVAVATTYVVNFSEDICGTVGGVGANALPNYVVSVYLSGVATTAIAANRVAGQSVKTDTNQITFTPTLPLSGQRHYWTYVTGVYDMAVPGNRGPVGTPSINSFRTIDNIIPTLTSVIPANAGVGVIISSTMTAVIDEDITGVAGTYLAPVMSLRKTSVPDTPLAGTIALLSDKRTLKFTPSSAMDYDASYQIRVSGIQDTGGNKIAVQTTNTFQTESSPLTSFYDVVGSTEQPFFISSSNKIIRAGEKRDHSSSDMNLRVIKRAWFALKKVGNPGGTLYVRIRENIESDDSVAVTFDTTLAANSVSTTKTRYSFSKLSNTYALTTNDAIFIELDGATQNTSNYISVYYDGGNPYDTGNSRYVSYNDTYSEFSGARDIDGKFEE